MKKLFDQFEQLSTEAQILLERGISEMRDGIAPAPSLCQDITSALSSLRTAYNDIRRTLPEHVLAEEMPEGENSVRVYEEVWKNSVVSRKKAVRDVLDEFIRVYSDEEKYMDAIEAYIRDAKEILANMDPDGAQSTSPDVSTFQLFLAGVRADLSSDEELCDQLLDNSAFTPRIVKGLFEKKYYIREANLDNAPITDTSCDEPVAKAESAKTSEISETYDVATVVPKSHAECFVSETQEEAEIETLSPEETVAWHTSDAKTSGNCAISEASDESEEDEEYIHPINPIKQTKLPSEQKLREMISRTGEVFRYLLEKLVFRGLMDERIVFEALAQLPKPVSREYCIESFAFLERKGILCTYEYDGRNILCFTELMESCLMKSGLSSMLKRVYHLKNIGKIQITGKQDMSLKLFEHHMAMVDLYSKVIEMLNADKETLKKLETSTWNHEKCYFLVNLKLDDGSLLPLHVVNGDEFESSVPDENEGVLCCSDDLPSMEAVRDQLHYCLTSNGLYHWLEGNWIAITHVEGADPDLPATDDFNVAVTNELDSQPEASQAETANSETVTAHAAPITPIKQQAIPAVESVEGLWLDDVCEEKEVETEVTVDEFANLSSTEIAGRLLNAASNGCIPRDENMAALIRQILREGVRSRDVHNCHDQIVIAMTRLWKQLFLQKCCHRMRPSRCAGTFTINFMPLFRFSVRQVVTPVSRC